jgi:release factor glutamine methyltransferase
LSSVGQWLSRHSDIERRERELLLCAAAELTRARLLTHPDVPLCADVLQRLEDWIARRRRGEPVAYLLGRQGFLDFDLAVSPAVLIPRPETELLVERALIALEKRWSAGGGKSAGGGRTAGGSATAAGDFGAPTPLRLLDLGTGSGAIALALARAHPEADVVGADISDAALAIARANAAALGAAITWQKSNWFETLSGRFDLIVSNPPYVAAEDPHLADLTFEPLLALVGGADGLDAFRTLVREAPRFLRRNGTLAFEHGYDQAAAVAALLRSRGFEDIETHRDLAGIPRVTLGCWREPEA